MGKNGTAISLCDETEQKKLKDIEKLIGIKFNIENLEKQKENIKNDTTNRLTKKKNLKKRFKDKSIKNFKKKRKKVAKNFSKKNI